MPSLRSRRSHSSKTPRRKTNGLFLEGNCPHVVAGSRSYKRIVSKLPLRRGWKPLLQAYRVKTAPTSRLEAAPTSVSCRNCPHVAAGSRSYKRIVSKLPLRRGWKPLLQAYRVETAPTSRLEAAPTSVSCRNCPYVAAGSRSYKRIVSKLPLRRG